MCPNFDDDIKIYKKPSVPDMPDFESLMQEINFNQANGNREKAVKLGEHFASLKPTDAVLGICASDEELPASVLYQARALITFLCGRTIKNNVKDLLLVDTARNAMYDALKTNEIGYYNNLRDGAAFSFYRLALKKEGDSAAFIGAEFAKLCGAARDAALAALGKRIYTATVAYASAVIEACGFQY